MQPALRECAFVTYFHFIIKGLSFFFIIGPVTGFNISAYWSEFTAGALGKNFTRIKPSHSKKL
jgi:hypothetical protein